MVTRAISQDLMELSKRAGQIPSVVIPSAIGLPEPSGLTIENWDAETDELIEALADAEDGHPASSQTSNVPVRRARS